MQRYWRDLSFTHKLRLSYVLVFMIPLLLLGGYSYRSSLSFVHSQLKQETDTAVERVGKEIETKLYQAESSLSLVANNYSFQEFLLPSQQLSALETNRIADMYIAPFLYNAMLSNLYIDKLEIYTVNDVFVLKDLIRSTKMIQNADWFQKISSSSSFYWWPEEDHLYVGKAIKNSITGRFLGVARMRVKEDLFTRSFESFVIAPANITISDSTEVIYTSNPESRLVHAYNITRTLTPLDWQISYDFNRQNISSFSNRQLLLNLVIILICLVLVGLIIGILSRSMIKRIFILTHQMQQVREGDLSIRVDTSYKDEIGSLALSFKLMLTRLNHLIEEKYAAELRQKELELRLLQEKINPHFLYNILSTINWIAIENDQLKISQITNDLATFYRTALNQGKEYSTLQTELANIKSYIALQQTARDEPFDVIYDISPQLLELQVPNFIFQPLVENAIEHGINTLRRDKGSITIRSQTEARHFLIFIEDNGKEMYNKYGEGLFDQQLYGYGLRNVHERIQLKAGYQYGIRLFSNSAGTHTVVTLPLLE
ncbi:MULTISPECIES: sensor histidine kinase [Paenibacillus]|uniref:sensor histidine kinase n=1 Tax=Paenibacillus TaxID=44249 RepID=UPI00096F0F87|nr:histidine kinase [Paenibacillus odorifer]OME44175.1 hypothetical protein BSK58_04625 [Paenibacillus odorifer]